MIFAILALACSGGIENWGDQGVRFVRDGVISDSPVEGGRKVGGERWLIERPWVRGEVVAVGGVERIAPLVPECLPLFHVELSDISTMAVQGGVAPNSAVVFSNDGSKLAIGGVNGELVVVDAWSGEVSAERRLSESSTKELAFSKDDSTLYAAEQSPDAFVHALDPSTLEAKWSFRLADIVESSPLPAGENRYGLYDLPAAYRLEVLPDGDIIALATHAWNDESGKRLNRSQLLRLTPGGEIRSAFPEEPVSATFPHGVINADVTPPLIAINSGHSADGEPPPGFPSGGVVVVDLDAMRAISTHEVEPLGPWFDRNYIWAALDSDPEVGALMGFGDGRLVVERLAVEPGATPQPHLNLSTGTPIMAGEVPISASVGFGELLGETIISTTSDTNIPWGAASPELRPPTDHPAANALRVHGLDGELLWVWHGEIFIQGLTTSSNGEMAVIGAGYRASDNRRDLYGAMLFDTTSPRDGRSGEERILARCPTANPIFFDHALSDDGRIAVVEYPYPDGEGGVVGSYRATVLR